MEINNSENCCNRRGEGDSAVEGSIERDSSWAMTQIDALFKRRWATTNRGIAKAGPTHRKRAGRLSMIAGLQMAGKNFKHHDVVV